jgi:hypothetical protein
MIVVNRLIYDSCKQVEVCNSQNVRAASGKSVRLWSAKSPPIVIVGYMIHIKGLEPCFPGSQGIVLMLQCFSFRLLPRIYIITVLFSVKPPRLMCSLSGVAGGGGRCWGSYHNMLCIIVFIASHSTVYARRESPGRSRNL